MPWRVWPFLSFRCQWIPQIFKSWTVCKTQHDGFIMYGYVRMFMIVVCFICSAMRGENEPFSKKQDRWWICLLQIISNNNYQVLFVFFVQNVFTKWTGEELGNFGDRICGGNRWQRPSHKISQAPRCAVSFFWKVQQCRGVFRNVFSTICIGFCARLFAGACIACVSSLTASIHGSNDTQRDTQVSE